MKIPSFAEAFEAAKEMMRERCESELYRRAVEGWDEPVYHRGQICGYIRKHSDRLLEFLLRAEMPEKYGNRKPIDEQSLPSLDDISDEELTRIAFG